MSFSQDTAEKVGLSRRTIERAVAIAAKLSPDVIDLVRQTDIARTGKELEYLAKLEPAAQKAVVQTIIDGNASKISDAEIQLQMKMAPAPISDSEKHFRTVVTSWNRLGRKERRKFLSLIGIEAETKVLDHEIQG